jgi:transcriptional regulator with XRE-family HTH domain
VTITAEQIKEARRLLGWSRIDLALKSAVELVTIHRIEAKHPRRNDQAFRDLQATFEAAGVEFIPETGGVRLRLSIDCREIGSATAGFDFDLREIVAFGGREISLRQALSEYVQAKQQAGAAALTGPICFRDVGKRPGSLDGAQMEQILASISLEELRRGDDE